MEHLPKPIRAVAVAVAAVMLAGLTGAAASSSTAATPRSSSSAALQGAAQAEQVRAGTMTSRVRGEFGRNGTVRGTFKPDRWIHRGGKVFAVGQLHAVLRRGNGTLVGTADRQVTLPLRNGTVIETARQPCDILNLVLGPLDLNLLGLHVTLNRVRLHIEAIPGPGNLLGNLLCAVAGLLDGNSPIRLTNILNRILGLVR
jgi:hypothetical protein